MNGCLVVFRMYCSLIALLVIFWALNLALSINFMAKLSPVRLYRTSTTLPKAPSPMVRISEKSSMLEVASCSPGASWLSDSSLMVPRNAWLSAPTPALNTKDEMPQFVTFTAKFVGLAKGARPERRRKCSSSTGRNGTSGTLRCDTICGVANSMGLLGLIERESGKTCGASSSSHCAWGSRFAEEAEPRSEGRKGSRASPGPAGTSTLNRGSSKSAPRLPHPERISPDSACQNKSATALSGLFLSKPNFSDGPHSQGILPARFLSLKSTAGSPSSTLKALTF
mmetsp:Transcript_80165/g.245045  ORF Transcript_80165/g.245045 Transcript_80165/m.245045 type:complete len:282 (-) Transcript_80165:1708-2553(-)